MADNKWKFEWRDDQCQAIVAAMDFIAYCCDNEIASGVSFRKFAGQMTKERVTEIADEIRTITG